MKHAGVKHARASSEGHDKRAGMSEIVRVLIVDDDALVRAGLTMMLDGADGIAVVGQAADGDEVGRAVEVYAPTWSSWTCACPTWTGSSPPGGCGAGRGRPK